MASVRRLTDNEMIMIANEYVDTNISAKELAKKWKMGQSKLLLILERLEIPKRRRSKKEWSVLAGRIKDSRSETIE